MFNFDDRKRLATFVQILITIDHKAKHPVKAPAKAVIADRKIAPARDKNGRFISNPISPKPQRKYSQLKVRKKADLFYYQDLRLSQTILSLHNMHRDENTT